MKLEDQVASLELSKRLKELGVKKESAFYWIKRPKSENALLIFCEELERLKDLTRDRYSAFTVTEAMEALKGEVYLRWHAKFKKWWVRPIIGLEEWFDAIQADALCAAWIDRIEKGGWRDAR